MSARFQAFLLFISDFLLPLPATAQSLGSVSGTPNNVTKMQREWLVAGKVKSARALWLPGQDTVTINGDGKMLRNTHAYSDSNIFNVDSASPKEAHEPAATA